MQKNTSRKQPPLTFRVVALSFEIGDLIIGCFLARPRHFFRLSLWVILEGGRSSRWDFNYSLRLR